MDEPGRTRAALRRPVLAVAAVLAALALRAACLVAYRHSVFHDVYRNDQLYYRTWALQIASGDPLAERVFSQGPLYAYLLAAAFRTFPGAETPVLALQFLAGMATAALVFWSGCRLWGPLAAGAAGALAAAYGPFLFYECMIMKTFLEPLLVVAALAAGLRGLERGTVRWFAAAGAAVGAACLVRESHVLLLAPLAIAAWRAGDGRPPRSRAARAGAVVAACLVTVAPATLHNWSAGGEFTPITTGGGQNAFIGFWPQATGYYTPPPFDSRVSYQEHEDYRLEASLRMRRRLSRAECSAYWLGEAARAIRDAPGRTLELVARKGLILFNDYERPDNENYGVARGEIPPLRWLPTFGWVVGPGALGLAVALRRGAAWLPAGFAAALVLEVLLTFNLGRYRAGLAVVWILFAGRGLAWLGSALVRRKGGGQPGAAVLAAALAAVAALTAQAFLAPPGAGRDFVAWENERFLAQARERASSREMIAPLARALETWPEGRPALLGDLALALDATGKVSEALPVFEQALAADPGAVGVRLRLAEALGEMGALGRAVEHARVLERQAPAEARVQVLLVRLLVRQSLDAPDDAASRVCFREAVGHLRQALALAPENAEARAWASRLARHLQG